MSSSLFLAARRCNSPGMTSSTPEDRMTGSAESGSERGSDRGRDFTDDMKGSSDPAVGSQSVGSSNASSRWNAVRNASTLKFWKTGEGEAPVESEEQQRRRKDTDRKAKEPFPGIPTHTDTGSPSSITSSQGGDATARRDRKDRKEKHRAVGLLSLRGLEGGGSEGERKKKGSDSPFPGIRTHDVVDSPGSSGPSTPSAGSSSAFPGIPLRAVQQAGGAGGDGEESDEAMIARMLGSPRVAGATSYENDLRAVGDTQSWNCALYISTMFLLVPGLLLVNKDNFMFFSQDKKHKILQRFKDVEMVTIKMDGSVGRCISIHTVGGYVAIFCGLGKEADTVLSIVLYMWRVSLIQLSLKVFDDLPHDLMYVGRKVEASGRRTASSRRDLSKRRGQVGAFWDRRNLTKTAIQVQLRTESVCRLFSLPRDEKVEESAAEGVPCVLSFCCHFPTADFNTSPGAKPSAKTTGCRCRHQSPSWKNLATTDLSTISSLPSSPSTSSVSGSGLKDASGDAGTPLNSCTDLFEKNFSCLSCSGYLYLSTNYLCFQGMSFFDECQGLTLDVTTVDKEQESTPRSCAEIIFAVPLWAISAMDYSCVDMASYVKVFKAFCPWLSELGPKSERPQDENISLQWADQGVSLLSILFEGRHVVLSLLPKIKDASASSALDRLPLSLRMSHGGEDRSLSPQRGGEEASSSAKEDEEEKSVTIVEARKVYSSERGLKLLQSSWMSSKEMRMITMSQAASAAALSESMEGPSTPREGPSEVEVGGDDGNGSGSHIKQPRKQKATKGTGSKEELEENKSRNVRPTAFETDEDSSASDGSQSEVDEGREGWEKSDAEGDAAGEGEGEGEGEGDGDGDDADLEEEKQWCHSHDFTRNLKRLINGSEEGKDRQSGSPPTVGSDQYVTALLFVQCGLRREYWVYCTNSTLYVWEASGLRPSRQRRGLSATGAVLLGAASPLDEPVAAIDFLAFIPDGCVGLPAGRCLTLMHISLGKDRDRVLAVGEGGFLVVCGVQQREILYTLCETPHLMPASFGLDLSSRLMSHSPIVRSVVYRPEQRVVIVADTRGVLSVWEILESFFETEDARVPVQWTSHADSLLQKSEPLLQLRHSVAVGYSILSFVFVPYPNGIALSSLTHLGDNIEVIGKAGQTRSPTQVAKSLLVAGSSKGIVLLIDPTPGGSVLAAQLYSPQSTLRAALFVPLLRELWWADGEYLHIMDVSEFNTTSSILAHRAKILALSLWSVEGVRPDDGSLVAVPDCLVLSASWDCSISMWNGRTRALLYKIAPAHAAPVRCLLSLTPQQESFDELGVDMVCGIATAGQDGTFSIWTLYVEKAGSRGSALPNPQPYALTSPSKSFSPSTMSTAHFLRTAATERSRSRTDWEQELFSDVRQKSVSRLHEYFKQSREQIALSLSQSWELSSSRNDLTNSNTFSSSLDGSSAGNLRSESASRFLRAAWEEPLEQGWGIYFPSPHFLSTNVVLKSRFIFQSLLQCAEEQLVLQEVSKKGKRSPRKIAKGVLTTNPVKGIPYPTLVRPATWLLWSGASYLQKQHHPNYYKRMQEKALGKLGKEEAGGKGELSEAAVISRQIEKDITRSFAEGNESAVAPEALDVLRRVLMTYAIHNTHVGYCQSMNIISAFFSFQLPEEECFWLICALCERLLPDTYTPTLLGARVHQRVFTQLVHEYMPRLHDFLAPFQIIETVCLPWFLCLFVTHLPTPLVVRVLDCFFCEGRIALFKVGLAIFRHHEAQILAFKDQMQVLSLFRGMISDVDPQQLLEIAYSEFAGVSNQKVMCLEYGSMLKVLWEQQEDDREWQRRVEAKQKKEEEKEKSKAANAVIVEPDRHKGKRRLMDGKLPSFSRKKKTELRTNEASPVASPGRPTKSLTQLAGPLRKLRAGGGKHAEAEGAGDPGRKKGEGAVATDKDRAPRGGLGSENSLIDQSESAGSGAGKK